MDKYQLRVYKSLRIKHDDSLFGSETHASPEAPRLVGYKCGNADREGCLTSDITAKIHSCESGNHCQTIKTSSHVVWIQPLIAHLPDNFNLIEVGIGRSPDKSLEVQLLDEEQVAQLCLQ